MMTKAMVRRNRESLKRKFYEGEMPSASAFADLIDSMLNIADEGFDKTPVDGLKVSQLNQGKLLSFYQNIDIKSPIWSVQLDGSGSGLAFGTTGNATVMTLREVQRDDQAGDLGHDNARSFELDMTGRIVADGRRGRGGSRLVEADGKWHDISDTLEGCNAFEITAGVGKKGSGKYAVMHAFAMMAFNDHGEITYHQSHYGSKCNRLQLQWIAAPDGARNGYRLQMRVGCSYDDLKLSKEKTWVRYYLTNLWFDPLMLECADNPEPALQP
jgi:hypothetical protein